MKSINWYISDINRRLTAHFYTSLTRVFYGLARIDVKEDHIVPMVKDANGNYKEALFNSRNDISAFWVKTGDREVIDGGTEQPVEVIFTVNMRSFNSDVTEEQIVDSAHEIIEITGFDIEDVAVDSDAIDDYDYSRYVYPYFCFKFSGTITV